MISFENEPSQFEAVYNLLMVTKDAKGAYLLNKLDLRLQKCFKDYIKDSFMKGSALKTTRLSPNIL